MTDYKLTEQDCKRLTEFLGECTKSNCTGCEKDYTNCDNWEKYLRTFTTPDDQHAVFTKLVEVGKWDGFYFFAWKELYFKDRVQSETAKMITQWLFLEPERFCKLVSDYLKEEDNVL